MKQSLRTFVFILVLTIISAVIALPREMPISFSVFGRNVETTLRQPQFAFTFFGRRYQPQFELKRGLDIQGGMQVVLQADMSQIDPAEREVALESAKEVMLRRVDLYGIAEPVVQTAQRGDEYRLIVELPGVNDPTEALNLIGTTAELDFRLFQTEEATESAETATDSAESESDNNEPASETATDSANLTDPNDATATAQTLFSEFQPTGLTGQQLKRAGVQFGQGGQSAVQGEPVVALEFDGEGTEIFRDITTNNTGQMLGIFLDGIPVMTPVINDPIPNGQAVITGGFTIEEARNLSIQLNAGALPVPISVLEQRTIGASLGQASVEASVKAGLIGLGLVMLFMILYYGFKGFLASLALAVYALLTIAVYKVLGVTLTLPGIAGLLLSIGMAVDANILIFERMKEELRDGKPFERALELGFGRAWDSIKDANLATIVTALVLINPFNVSFLNTSGLVRGFGITLFIGVLISLFTGVVVTRTFMRLFLQAPADKKSKKK